MTEEIKINERGSKYWYKNGKLHRLDGPAVEYINGDKIWYKNDELHNIYGPAVLENGIEEYWIEGKQLSEKEFYSYD